MSLPETFDIRVVLEDGTTLYKPFMTAKQRRDWKTRNIAVLGRARSVECIPNEEDESRNNSK